MASTESVVTDAHPSPRTPASAWVRRHATQALMGLQRRLRIWPGRFGLVTGPPRSGTTAMVQWLGRRPDVAGFWESRVLIAGHRLLDEVHRFKRLDANRDDLIALTRRLVYDHYARQQVLMGRRLILDKEPLEPIALPDARYAAFLANVRLLIPEARLVFMIRDPLATVFSMTQRTWGHSLHPPEYRSFSLETYAETWCACVEALLPLLDDPRVYVRPFGRLVAAPEEESARIAEFLDLPRRAPFEPQPTRTLDFSPEDRAFVQQRTQPQREALHARGILC